MAKAAPRKATKRLSAKTTRSPGQGPGHPLLPQGASNAARPNINGVLPHLAVVADMLPKRTETGIGALMPWADKLWMVTYPSSGPTSGGGTGLFTIDRDLNLAKHPQSRVGTYANRMVHAPTGQMMIGPHLVDIHGKVRTIDALAGYRLTATMEHLDDPATKVYVLGMEGHLFEVDVLSLAVRELGNLCQILNLPVGCEPHFKGGFTSGGRVVVANNTYTEIDHAGAWTGGCLAEWDGATWTILDRTAYNEVAGRSNMGEAIFATGWDRASAILKVFVPSGPPTPGAARPGQWQTYRLPKASHCFDHFWQTEWPRIREAESERYLMDCHGMFYELSPIVFGGRVGIIRPIATHLRIIPDFCGFLGLLVLAGNQTTPIGDAELQVGQPQANLWLGKTDDLWRFGPPKGWGGVWVNAPVKAGVPSDPFLMTGFANKVLHVCHDATAAVTFGIEVDFLGDGTWRPFGTMQVGPRGYLHYSFPPGFSAHWVRLTASADCTATGYFIYS